MTGPVQRLYNERIRERLLERSELMPSGCLVWTGASGGNAVYGAISYKGKWTAVHRLAWELEHGPIPPGLVIDHVRARGCIFKRCINVEHLGDGHAGRELPARVSAQFYWPVTGVMAGRRRRPSSL